MGKSSINLIKKLIDDGVKLNITALFTEQQVQETVSALNINTKSIISIFAGRIADTGKDPTILIKKTLSLIGSNKNHEVLWASTRQIFNIIEADDIGCNIITFSLVLVTAGGNLGHSVYMLSEVNMNEQLDWNNTIDNTADDVEIGTGA